MAAVTPHHPRGGAGRGGASPPSQRQPTSPLHSQTPHVREPVPFDAAELAAGCALNEGFQLLHSQLIGVPTTLRALLAVARRRKWTEGMPTTNAAGLASLKKKLLLVPPLLAEWHGGPSLAAAQLLCAQARQLFAGIPLTRRFLRARSLAFQHEAAAHATGVTSEVFGKDAPSDSQSRNTNTREQPYADREPPVHGAPHRARVSPAGHSRRGSPRSHAGWLSWVTVSRRTL